MKKPIIGIVLDLVSGCPLGTSYSERPFYALRRDYSDIVTKYGGIPLFLPYCAEIDDLLKMIDGLIIPGGDEDINPKFYGQEITSSKVKVNDKRASFELALVKKALEIDIPILGICNGLQVINVVLGGTLIQHIPDSFPSHINHEQPHPKNIPTHPVIIEKNTFVSTLCSSSIFEVNTTHHQAIDKIGAGIKISAKAPDGIIEAIELPGYRFVVGVQWHSEYQNTELDKNLVKRLIEESKKFV